ncbi:hypothetical protein ASPU41_18190 [Arthrobacter sp. U41]|nr:hypothetical protein ASPU41_18190 [Arthrobacter sp. U41]
MIICQKSNGQVLASPAWYSVKWDTHVHTQGITHTPGDSTFIVSEAGIYQVNTRVAFNGPNVTGSIMGSVNGIHKSDIYDDEIGGATAWPKPQIIQYVKLNAGDALEIVAYANVANTEVSSQSTFQLAKVAGF